MYELISLRLSCSRGTAKTPGRQTHGLKILLLLLFSTFDKRRGAVVAQSWPTCPLPAPLPRRLAAAPQPHTTATRKSRGRSPRWSRAALQPALKGNGKSWPSPTGDPRSSSSPHKQRALHLYLLRTYIHTFADIIICFVICLRLVCLVSCCCDFFLPDKQICTLYLTEAQPRLTTTGFLVGDATTVIPTYISRVPSFRHIS